MSKRIVLFILTTALAVVVSFFIFVPSEAIVVVRKVGYWIILTEFGLFSIFLWKSVRGEDWRKRLVCDWRWAVIVLSAAGFLHLHEPHGVKIMADEAVLNSTAMQMHFEREAAVVIRGYDVAGNFTPTVVYLDKRPLFFPFLVSLVHDFTGYRFENVFVLNALLSVLFMALTFLIGRKLAGNGAGVVAMLLMCSIPLVAQNATGAGFELLNMVMILAVILLGMRFLEEPNDDRLSALVLAGVLLAQVRYESVLFILPVGAVIVLAWWRAKKLMLPPILLASPLLLVLCPLQYNVFKVSESTWQLSDIPGAKAPFGFEYFHENIGHAFAFFLSYDGTQPNSILVGVLGALAAGFCILIIYKDHQVIFKRRPIELAWVVFFIGLLVHTGLMLCYFWGRWDDPIIRRLSLPCHILLVFAFVMAYPRLFASSRRWIVAGVVIAIYIFAFTIPSSAMYRYTKDSIAGDVATWVNSIAARQKGRVILALDMNNGFIWMLHRQASVPPILLADRPHQFLYHYRLGTFDDILVVQRISVNLKTEGKGMDVQDDLGPGIKLSTLEERKFSTGYSVRVSRIASIDEEKFLKWVEAKHAEAKLPESSRTAIVIQRTEGLSEWFENLP